MPPKSGDNDGEPVEQTWSMDFGPLRVIACPSPQGPGRWWVAAYDRDTPSENDSGHLLEGATHHYVTRDEAIRRAVILGKALGERNV